MSLLNALSSCWFFGLVCRSRLNKRIVSTRWRVERQQAYNYFLERVVLDEQHGAGEMLERWGDEREMIGRCGAHSVVSPAAEPERRVACTAANS